MVNILAVDNEQREAYSSQNNGRLPIVKFINADTFLNFLSSIHRMEIICLKGFAGDSNDPENLDIVGEIDSHDED